MRQEQLLRIERAGNKWFVCDPRDRSTGVKVDAASVAAIKTYATAVEGYILAVHGLDHEVCKGFDQRLFNALGVASHLKNFVPPAGQKFRRVQLTVEGEIQAQ
jgi:hypothetical protein